MERDARTGSFRILYAMVFFDPTGTRKILFWTLASAFFIAILAAAALAYAALLLTPTADAVAYEPLSSDSGEFDKTIALTFDDGPHPTYTPLVMQLLQEEEVPATFFLIGEQVAHYPDVAKLIVLHGFEIGNHTFTHSENVARSETRLRSELVATDRIIRSATGRTTKLFRPPFLEDVKVGEFDGGKIEGDEIRWAENAGFIVVGANLDTQDWNVEPGESETILARLEDELREDGPTVIIMHESAGDGATIEALRTFIPLAKERGYRFVLVSDYFGLTRDQAMPYAPDGTVLDAILVSAERALAMSSTTFNTIVLIVSVLGLARLWTILATRRLLAPLFSKTLPAHAARKRESMLVRIPTRYRVLRALWRREPQLDQKATIIIPAYNEEANIEATVRSVMSSRERMPVIVVDDGSTDNTASIVRKLAAEFDPWITLLQKKNDGSKASALNFAIPYAESILVCIDADTVIEPDTIELLLQHFDDPRVGAVAGKIYPAMTRTLLEKFQYLEYMQGQNLEKRVMAMGNAIGVVPGALGAWRKSALIEAGGYSDGTVVEDQDLTLCLLSRGWQIRFEPRAHAYTETPSTVRNFFRQRSRWVYGTIQCTWKYRAWLFSLRRPQLGWIILPNLIFFNLCVPLLIPTIDVGMILGLFGWIDIWVVLVPFLVFTLFDMWCAIEGIAGERRLAYRLIPLVVWQRFFYRYCLAAAVAQSFVLALAGSLVRWGAQNRRGECHPALRDMLPQEKFDYPMFSKIS